MFHDAVWYLGYCTVQSVNGQTDGMRRLCGAWYDLTCDPVALEMTGYAAVSHAVGFTG